MKKRNIVFEIAYEGTRYSGWQRQGNTDKTVSGRIEEALRQLYGAEDRTSEAADRGRTPVAKDPKPNESDEFELAGAGRTDAGVHAMCQVANVRLHCEDAPERIREKLNAALPMDIRILRCYEADDRFHARLKATGKVYEYVIVTGPVEDLWLRNRAWQMKDEPDIDAMRAAAELLIGEHDYLGFSSLKASKKSTVRRVDSIEIRKQERPEGGSILRLTFTGTGFLYHMVRILVGTLVEVGLHQRSVDAATRALDTLDRADAGPAAPAMGLYLVKVIY